MSKNNKEENKGKPKGKDPKALFKTPKSKLIACAVVVVLGIIAYFVFLHPLFSGVFS